MKVHFKGTRGSLPTAPTAQEIEEKIIASLMAARGKELRSERQIREFVSTKLNFRTRSHWVEILPAFMLKQTQTIT